MPSRPLYIGIAAIAFAATGVRAGAQQAAQGGSSHGGDEHGALETVADDEKAAFTAEAVSRMRAILKQTFGYLAEARDQRDVVKLNCVNEKLTAIKGLLRIAERSDVTMQEALARRDPEVAQHEFEKVSIAKRKCEQLLAESEACVGELAVYAGDTKVEVVISGEPEGDPTELTQEELFVERPPAASPFQ